MLYEVITIENEKVTLIQSTPTDSDLVALLQLIDACEGAAEINVVVPYMGYARQDKKFKPGEPISARAIARCINADRVFTVNIHERSVLEHFPCPAVNLDAASLVGEYIAGSGLENPRITSYNVCYTKLLRNYIPYPEIQRKYNTVLAIDCSGSMGWNDPISYA